MERLPAVTIVFQFLIVVCSSQLQPKTGFNCTAQRSCGACIAESPDCGWCKAPDYLGDRCNLLVFLYESNCSREHIVNPDSEINETRNEAPRNGKLNSAAPVQLAPQEIHIKLRPNKPFQFTMNFRQAQNYPVDIYFIMDVSNTMKNYKDTLATFSHLLVTKIGNITNDFHLGFGSFVDKAVLPFVATGPNNAIVSQCGNCTTPYGFRNQLNLTKDDTEFKKRVASLEISGNLDAPEGGFDAIMQAIACTKEIGWRDQSRKMILFSTDGSFHYAGDGKLGGVVIPNDGQCHLTADGYYSESVTQDYPSISQLAQKISEKKVNVIFMVPAGKAGLYRRLSEHVLGSNVGELDANMSNVIDLVQQNYDRILGEVELKTENLGDVKIAFQVKCPTGEVQNYPRCDKIKIGQSVSFNVTVNVLSCPSDRSQWKKTFQIYPVGLTEKLTVHLDLMCECPCELPGQEVPNSQFCNSSGTYECGSCTCNRGYYGKNCECGAASLEEHPQYDRACRKTNTSEVCEGKGHCDCGQCVCNAISPAEPNKRLTGTFCECNDYNCNYFGGEICGGPTKGFCKCGKCVCIGQYSNVNGEACHCLNTTDPCKTSKGAVCNGKGTCVCGVCDCLDVFKGPTCEDCPTCPGKCEENHECVQCQFRDKDHTCYRDCSAKNKTISLVEDAMEKDDWRSCLFRDEDQCDIRFIYNYKTNEVNVKRTKECVQRVNNLIIILSVVGAVIAIGIITLLIWKALVMFHDEREYKAFMEEKSKARWNVAQNPVYKPATTNFQNPTYRPGSTINH